MLKWDSCFANITTICVWHPLLNILIFSHCLALSFHQSCGSQSWFQTRITQEAFKRIEYPVLNWSLSFICVLLLLFFGLKLSRTIGKFSYNSAYCVPDTVQHNILLPHEVSDAMRQVLPLFFRKVKFRETEKVSLGYIVISSRTRIQIVNHDLSHKTINIQSYFTLLLQYRFTQTNHH